MEEEKKVSDESIVEEAKGETPEETTTQEGTETQETKETKTKKKKKFPKLHRNTIYLQKNRIPIHPITMRTRS